MNEQTPVNVLPEAPESGAATPRRDADYASLAELKAWHKEGVQHFLKYEPRAREEEGAVYGEQWTKDEIEHLAGEDRIDMVFNHIQKNVLTLVGYRADNKLEVQYLPKEISDSGEGEILDQVAKHYLDACLAEYEMQRSCFQQYVGPMGWVYCGYEYDDPAREPFKLESVPWSEMRYDPRRSRYDFLDARYQSRERWFDLADAKARFPEHAEALEEYATTRQSHGDTDEVTVDRGGEAYSDANTKPIAYLSERKEVRIIETWYRRTKRGWYLKTATGWEAFDAHKQDHQAHRFLGAEMKPGIVHCVYYATWCGRLILEEGKTPYSHPYFPYVAIWGLVDHEGLPMGAVHAQMDPQKSLNWNASKLMWLTDSDAWLYPEGSIDDLELWKKNAARPDALLPYNADETGRKPEQIDRSQQVQLAREGLDRAMMHLREIAGSPEAMRGQTSNETSAIAIEARKDGALTQQGIFLDNEKRAWVQIGIMWKSYIMDKVTDETIIRIAMPNGQQALAAVNVNDPLRRAELEQQGYQVFGSVSRINYDTKVAVSPTSTTIRQRHAAQMDAVARFFPPDLFAAIADLWILGKDVPKKEEIAERISARVNPQPAPMPAQLPPGMPPMDPAAAPVLEAASPDLPVLAPAAPMLEAEPPIVPPDGVML